MPDVPIYNMDLPYPLFQRDQDHRDVWGYYHKYIVKELRGLVTFVEEQTGKKMDYDRLRELVDLSDRTWNLIHETYELRKAVPCPMGTGDAMNTMVPICFMMATQEAYDFFLNLNKELKEKIAKKGGRGGEREVPAPLGRRSARLVCPERFQLLQQQGALLPGGDHLPDGRAPRRDGHP